MSVFLPKVCARARTEVVVSAVLFVVTMAAFVLFFVENYINSHNVLSRFVPATGAERVVYNLIFAVFMFGSFTYQVSRLSFFWKLRKTGSHRGGESRSGSSSAARARRRGLRLWFRAIARRPTSFGRR